MTEARIVDSEDGGRGPETDGWFVLNAKDSRWLDGDLGRYTNFEGKDVSFPQLGINLNIMNPGESMTMYHRENTQEDFLVLCGECVLVVEGEARPLKRWDLFHCPAGTNHAIVGAGDGPCLVLAVVDPVAQQYRTGVDVETSTPAEAYKPYSFGPAAYKKGWLPE
jgi:uncharacterized cupin superfamily protein